MRDPPVTLGHEVPGEIVGMGKGVRGWKIGQRVTSETYFYTCGGVFTVGAGVEISASNGVL
jgi:L-iditol 2-dehydrogenase